VTWLRRRPVTARFQTWLAVAGATAGRSATSWNEVGGTTETSIKVGWNLLALVAERLRVRLTVAI
jgi:hypothetical protein